VQPVNGVHGAELHAPPALEAVGRVDGIGASGGNALLGAGLGARAAANAPVRDPFRRGRAPRRTVSRPLSGFEIPCGEDNAVQIIKHI